MRAEQSRGVAFYLFIPFFGHRHQLLVQFSGEYEIVPLDDVAVADLCLDIVPIG